MTLFWAVRMVVAFMKVWMQAPQGYTHEDFPRGHRHQVVIGG